MDYSGQMVQASLSAGLQTLRLHSLPAAMPIEEKLLGNWMICLDQVGAPLLDGNAQLHMW